MVRLAFAGSKEKDGLVAEPDARFTMRLPPAAFMEWREREPVRGARVVVREPEPPPERSWS